MNLIEVKVDHSRPDVRDLVLDNFESAFYTEMNTSTKITVMGESGHICFDVCSTGEDESILLYQTNVGYDQDIEEKVLELLKND